MTLFTVNASKILHEQKTTFWCLGTSHPITVTHLSLCNMMGVFFCEDGKVMNMLEVTVLNIHKCVFMCNSKLCWPFTVLGVPANFFSSLDGNRWLLQQQRLGQSKHFQLWLKCLPFSAGKKCFGGYNPLHSQIAHSCTFRFCLNHTSYLQLYKYNIINEI